MVSTAAPDYDRLSRLLAGVELAPSPAEAQGMLCGLLALHLPDPIERWQAQLSVEPDADLDALDQLAAWTQASIEPPSVSFDVFLPSEDRPLVERATAALDWVRGLLFGLVLGGLGRDQLFGQAGEAFDDLVELTRMDLDAVAEGHADEEADEEALTEIVEFLRVAAMLIREDRVKALIDERDRQAGGIGLH
ncbi:MAG: UPF0149 family protein [Lamprobacter sp.]|uniref:UPF0149 family protein n=1 Tax=Lamprobacter sp. TaxID=3100796 RepID=UPI002B262171|nr:UPF0149 family protein [Lamprobacter sp.]MEA3639650.1 UPF0149 family protein [Lamprobacter sp.]